MVNIQKSMAFLYISNEKVKLEIKNTLPFMLASKNKNPKILKYQFNRVHTRSIREKIQFW